MDKKMTKDELSIRMDHESLHNSRWTNDNVCNNQEHAVIFIEYGRLYALVNMETGEAASELTFEHFEDLIDELIGDGWEELI